VGRRRVSASRERGDSPDYIRKGKGKAKRKKGKDSHTAADPEYQRAHQYLKNREFIRAVEALEGLVVQRLFELAKANLSGTGMYLKISSMRTNMIYEGYKLRKQISKAIVRRSAAIRNALDKYNRLAPLQTPPRPTLQYADIAAYGWLGEFDLLKHSRYDTLKKPWAIPANREFAIKHFKILGARAEIHRLNIETRRLEAWAFHEDQHLLSVAAHLATTDPLLSAEVTALHAERHRVNNVHRAYITSLHQLDGYTGLGPYRSGDITEDQVAVLRDLNTHVEILTDEDDTVHDEVTRLGDCIESLD
jgi:hypothetical protein